MNAPAVERVVLRGAGVDIVGDRAGELGNPSLIFMHGGGQTRNSWGKAVVEAAQRGYLALAVDLRGHGESGWSPDGRYSQDIMAGDIRNVLEQTAGDSVLVGASIGGAIGLILAAEPNARVSGLILVDAVPRGEQQGMREIGEFMSGTQDGFASLDAAVDAVAAYLPHRTRKRNPQGLMKNLRLREDGRYVWHWDPAFIQRSGDSEVRPDPDRLEAAARSLTAPTLLIRGALSRVVSREGAQDFLRMVPHAEFVDVADADHMVAGDDNDSFNSAIFDFLARHARARPAGAGPGATVAA